MAKLCLKKKSKRISASLRYKIQKKVKDHNRKVRKEDKKRPRSHKTKVIKVPQDCPFRDDILKEVADLKMKKEEDKLKRRALWKEDRDKLKQLQKETNTIDDMVSDAEKKQKIYEAFKPKEEEKPFLIKKDGSLKAYYREFMKVVEVADVILEVVDARDPLGTRCSQVEEAVQESGGMKKLVIVVNKADLVPREILDQWLKYLRGSFPAVPFKASTQSQQRNLGRKAMSKGKYKKMQQNISVSSCVGAELLMSLLANYCRKQNTKTAITVGIVGLPNVGKSSIINSLKRSRACNVGATPGVTRLLQEVQLDSKIKLLDSPGLVFEKSTGSERDDDVSLKNAIKVESIADPFRPANTILRRLSRDYVMELYGIGEYDSPNEFFAMKAKRTGKYKKGGVADLEAAARGLIEDWNRGRIRFFMSPPEEKNPHISSAIVEQMSKDFDIAAIESMEIETLNEIETVQASKKDSIVSHMDTKTVEPMDEDKRENVTVMKSESRKRKMEMETKINAKEAKKEAQLVPTSDKKLLKVLAKKRRKNHNRAEKKADALTEELDSFDFKLGKSEDYDFNEAFEMS